jgi:replication factor A1
MLSPHLRLQIKRLMKMNGVEQIAARLKELGVAPEPEEIERRLMLLVEKFRVPDVEARRSVLNYFLKEHGVKPPKVAGSERMKISQIAEAGKWIDIEVKVLELQPATSPAISQAGTVADETGAIRFVKWAKAELPDLVEGQSYLLKNVVTDAYQGRYSIKLNRTSEISPLQYEVKSCIAPRADVKIGDISAPGLWIDLKVKIVRLWDSTNEAISQSGIVGDETGTIRFIKWTKAGLSNVEEGRSYILGNVVTDEYQGRYSIKLNKTSTITLIDEDIAVASSEASFEGAIVDVQKGSGLIKRCPLCNRSLNKGICTEHGKQEGTYDLRIKAALDNGETVQDILINRERTESLIGLTLEEAKKMAMDALDHEVVLGIIDERLVGKYYRATGPRVDRYLLVESIEELPPVMQDEIDGLIKNVEAI